MAFATELPDTENLGYLEANNIPILLVFLPVFSVVASVTESQLCALRRALKTNQNPVSYGEIIYFQVPCCRNAEEGR